MTNENEREKNHDVCVRHSGAADDWVRLHDKCSTVSWQQKPHA